MGSLKYKNNPWPTDGVTKKYADRQYDRLFKKYQRLREESRRNHQEIRSIIEFLETGPHRAAWAIFSSEDK